MIKPQKKDSPQRKMKINTCVRKEQLKEEISVNIKNNIKYKKM